MGRGVHDIFGVWNWLLCTLLKWFIMI